MAEDALPTSNQSASGLNAEFLPQMVLALIFAAVIYFIIKKLFKPQKLVESVEESPALSREPAVIPPSKAGAKKNAQIIQPSRKNKDTFCHSLLVTNLKGHTAEIGDVHFSQNGKYLVSCGEGEDGCMTPKIMRHQMILVYFLPSDRAVHLWTAADFLSDTPAKEIRLNRLNCFLQC